MSFMSKYSVIAPKLMLTHNTFVRNKDIASIKLRKPLLRNTSKGKVNGSFHLIENFINHKNA